MCCLFGMIDYGNSLTGKQKSRLLSVLATECEARGTDATGIAYNSGGKLRIYKRPLPGHKMKFRIPDDATVIMGHTRLTTQGDAKKNRNNHPFSSNALNRPFAVAHNGVLYNDTFLRKSLRLPATDIETDSYIAVQLIERQKALNFNSLKTMAEAVEGSFCFTVLDGDDSLYFVKGDNPMCIYHYPRLGLYFYASTEEILSKAIQRSPWALGKETQVKLYCGDILQIGADGQQTKSGFYADDLFYGAYFRGSYVSRRDCSWEQAEVTTEEAESISRFARNTRDLLELIEQLNSKGVEFVSQKEAIDTTTPTGKFMLTIFGAVAELEREYILQRQREGIEIAKANGTYKGRKPVKNPAFPVVAAQWRAGKITAAEAMRKLDMKPSTFYRKAKASTAAKP